MPASKPVLPSIDHGGRLKVLSVQFIRPLLLFCALIAIGGITLHQMVYSRSWHKPLDVVIYPINADSSLESHNYINTLSTDTFNEIDDWFAREAKRHQVPIHQPVKVSLGPRVKSVPPPLPVDQGILRTVLWGLQMRYWVYRNTPDDKSNLRRVRVFVAYHKGEEDIPLAHSVGLQKGLIGVVNAFGQSEQTKQNNIVIAHEVLHTVGASDKYNFVGGPEFPYGYANPHREPLYPQKYAEVMAGRIPTSPYSSYMARSLKSVRINELTASEIAWLK